MTISENNNVDETTSIIIPPPDIRNVIDRTAQFVAELGAEFEVRVKTNESNNPKFNFLISTDPYNGYYQRKVKQYLDGTAELTYTTASVPTQLRLAQDTPKAIQEAFEPKEPPPEFEFIADPPSINSLELDIVKLTAQFVARNGRQFLTQLMNREQRNYLFDFLRPQHNMFTYFTKLVEQYTKILLPPKDIIERLEMYSKNADLFTKNSKYRQAWDRHQARLKKREMEAEDKERVAYGQIDWHDFVVVEVVDYQAHEVGNFPPPTIPEEVGARAIAEERGEIFINKWVENRIEEEIDEDEETGDESDVASDHVESAPALRENDDMDVEDMEMSDDDEVIPAPPPSQAQPPMQTFKPPQVITNISKNALVMPDEVVIKPYDPKIKVKRPTDELHLISPFGDNKKIPESQANQHIHVTLLAPNWRESKVGNVRNRNQEESPYAPGNLVDTNLKSLAERRTDIFGSQEIEIGRKLGEDGTKNEKYVWDGHSTVSEAYLKRPAEHKDRVDDDDKKNGLYSGATSASMSSVDLDKIGPQAIPQQIPMSAITVIVNTPIISQPSTQLSLDNGDNASPTEPKRPKVNE